VLEYASYPSVEDGLTALSVYGGYALNPAKATEQKGSTKLSPPSRRGTVPAHIKVSEKSSYSWRIYVDRDMTLNADVSYAFQGTESKGTVSVSSQAGKLKSRFKSTGLFVGEPNAGWEIESFNSHRLGKLEFTEAGYYDITLDIDPRKGEEIAFQWLWLGE
jgi:alpha-L-fucosidase